MYYTVYFSDGDGYLNYFVERKRFYCHIFSQNLCGSSAFFLLVSSIGVDMCVCIIYVCIRLHAFRSGDRFPPHKHNLNVICIWVINVQMSVHGLCFKLHFSNLCFPMAQNTCLDFGGFL